MVARTKSSLRPHRMPYDRDRTLDIVLYAILGAITVSVLYPLIYVTSASFSNPVDVLNGNMKLLPIDLTLEGYRRVFRNSAILIGYKNTILYTVVGTIVNVAVTVATAYPLSRKDFVGRNLFTILFTFTMFFSGGLIPTYLVIRSLGLINNFWVMILPGTISVFNVIIARTFFKSAIPAELQEAAMIDGCSNIGILVRIVIPLSKPILAVLALFYAVAHWNAFFNALIYLNDRERFPLQLILREILLQNQMINTMTQTGDSDTMEMELWSESIKYSIMIVASLPVLVIYPFFQRFFVKGLMIGAIKG